MAERPRKLDQRFQGGQFEAKFEADGLLFMPLRHDAIYAYLLNHVYVYVSRGTLWAYQMAFYGIKRLIHIIVSVRIVHHRLKTSQIIHLLVLTTTSEYRYLLILAVKRGRRFSNGVGHSEAKL